MKIRFCPFHGTALVSGPLGWVCPSMICDVAWADESMYGRDSHGPRPIEF